MYKAFYIIFSVSYIFCLPGYLMSKAFLRSREVPLAWITGAALAAVLLPVLAFGLAMLLHTVISGVLLFSLATIINSALLLIRQAQRRENRVTRGEY